MLKKKEYIKPDSLVVCFECIQMIADSPTAPTSPSDGTGDKDKEEEDGLVKGFNVWDEAW